MSIAPARGPRGRRPTASASACTTPCSTRSTASPWREAIREGLLLLPADVRKRLSAGVAQALRIAEDGHAVGQAHGRRALRRDPCTLLGADMVTEVEPD